MVDRAPAFAANVVRSLYQGGRTVVDVTPADDPATTLNLSLQSNEAPASGTAIRLALIDGWVVPNRG